MTPEELFQRWFVIPVETLEKLDRGDGAFVALMSVLPLYERAIIARLKLAGMTATDDAIKIEIEKDLAIAPAVRGKFWAIFRNGFMHQGMGLDGKTKWRILGSYESTEQLPVPQMSIWSELIEGSFASQLRLYPDYLFHLFHVHVTAPFFSGKPTKGHRWVFKSFSAL